LAFIDLAEAAGVLVMRSGIVDNNTRRKLRVDEFRGFALVDEYAPLVFLNGSDSKAAQMFTLAHELAHIWLGETGIFDIDVAQTNHSGIERWCNKVAAELLVPLQHLQENIEANEVIEQTIKRFTKFLFDAGQINRQIFFSLYQEELVRISKIKQASGGDFYRNQPRKLSPTFASALIGSAVEGQTSFRDAMRMLGVKKSSTFYELGRKLQVVL